MVLLIVTALVCSIYAIDCERKEWKCVSNSAYSSSVIDATTEGLGKSNKQQSEDNTSKNNKKTKKTKSKNKIIVESTMSDNIVSLNGYSNCDVPSNNTIKSYMDYRCITLKSSRQYKLQHSLAYTGDHGIRMVNGRYCVAVGSYYTTTIGTYIDIELENGKVIQGILADCKSDAHTDSTNRINPNGSVVEFVVDVSVLDHTAKIMGDISYVNGWNSKIVNIKVYDKIEEF